MVANSAYSLAVVDLAPFFNKEVDEEDGKNRKLVVVEEISKACTECGFFQVVNHGIPLELLKQTLDAYRAFFDLSNEEKHKLVPNPRVPTPASGYFRSPDLKKEGNEHFLIRSPQLGLNSYPKCLPRFQGSLEEIYPSFLKLASVMESIINDSLGFPPNFLKEYNRERDYDFLLGLHYFPATGTETVGKSAHEDTSCVSILYQDDVGGLQVCHNGRWISVPPIEGALVVNIGEVLRVLSNDRFKSATHKVMRSEGRNRYSLAFFHNLKGDKWVEPLPQFTKEIGELPKYRGFLLKEYMQMRLKDRRHPPERYEDLTRINYYAINQNS
ncbi:OLC1v1035539C1 [Oldenlandia corymbosa var. corymbosa]|uniref:OLC1v1035539C1 n=1 Tax=Oldenlandia corymbosa var. corymbosa TaxID=529605 RepID=A0AAV1CUL9_OLDCO|nr:OLC1v1035539C1 [Oldenlandia corymbosa var. corymbosa]